MCHSSIQCAFSPSALIFCQLLKGAVEITNFIFDLSVFSLLSITYLYFVYSKALWLGVDILRILSWNIGLFVIMKWPSLYLAIFLALKSTLLGIHIATLFLWLVLVWLIAFHHFTYFLFPSQYLYIKKDFWSSVYSWVSVFMQWKMGPFYLKCMNYSCNLFNLI